MNNKTPHLIIWIVPFILLLFLSICTINFGSSPPNQRGQNQEQLDKPFGLRTLVSDYCGYCSSVDWDKVFLCDIHPRSIGIFY